MTPGPAAGRSGANRLSLGWPGWLCALCLAVGFLASAFSALRQPLALGDYVAVWGLKARAIHRSGDLSSVFRVDPEGSFSHPEYPPLWPLVLAGTSRVVGRYDELWLAALRPLLLLFAAAFAFRATRAPLPFRLLPPAALTLLPYFREPAYAGYAEGLLVVFVLGALSELPALGVSRAGGLRFALFLALAAATKQEGVLVAGVAVVVLLAARRREAIVTAVAVLGLAVLPWAVFRQLHDTDTSAPLADFAFSAFRAGNVAAALEALAREALVPGIPWLLGAFAVLLLSPATRRARRPLLLATGIYAGALFVAFAFARLDPAWLVHWTWDRLALVPIVALLPVLGEAAAEAS